MTKSEYILKTVLYECIIHSKRMNSAYMKIQNSLPLDHKKISNLTEDELEHLDQYIYRFSKLQDSIGNRLFKSLLFELGEDYRNKPLIDIFNRLEQLEIISDYDTWKELRDIRNESAHDYKEDTKETAERLSSLLNKKSQLEKYLTDIIDYLSKNHRGH